MEANQTFENHNRDHVGIVVFQAIIFIIAETAGNFFLLALILFEKYGMDPQKRTMSNQILSSICACFIFFNLVMYPIWFVYRIHYFDIVWIKIFVVYGLGALGGFVSFSLAEMVLVRLFYIFCFSKTTIINENFATLVLTMFKLTFVLMAVVVKLILREYSSNPFIVEVNHGFQDDFHRRVNLYTTWTPLFISIPIILVGVPIIYYKKKQAGSVPNNVITLPPIPAPVILDSPAILEAEDQKSGDDEEALPPGIIRVMPCKNDDHNNEMPEKVQEITDDCIPEVVIVEPENPPSPINAETNSNQDRGKAQDKRDKLPSFNTNRFNENLVKNFGIVSIVFAIIVFAAPILIFNQFGLGMYDFFSIYMFSTYGLLITLLPLSFFLKRPRKLLEVLEMFGVHCNALNNDDLI